MHRHCLMLLLVFGWVVTDAQPVIRFLHNSVNVGKVAADAWPPASFPFVNDGDSPLAVLMVQKSPGTTATYNRSFINPGDTGYVFLHSGSDRIGPFQADASVISNASGVPVKLSISGERLSVNSCFPDPKNLILREVHVLDSLSHEPVIGAEIVMNWNMQKEIHGKTGRNGIINMELPIGMYAVKVKAQGYPDRNWNFFIPKTRPVIWLQLASPSKENPINEPVKTIIQDQPVLPGEPVLSDAFAENNIVLLLDVSLSMSQEGKLDLMKEACGKLIDALRPVDHVSVISYSDQARVIGEAIPGDHKSELRHKIAQLKASGSTNGVKGLEAAYLISGREFIAAGNNQVILATDGKFNAGNSNPSEVEKMVKAQAEKGIKLSVIGLGKKDISEKVMQSMADAGSGRFLLCSPENPDPGFLLEEVKKSSRKEK